MNVMAGSLGGRFPFLRNDRFEVISVLTNNTCNLKCRHCYLQASFPNAMRDSEWMLFFESLFSDMAPAVLCFAGKEPLYNDATVRLWANSIRLRDQIQPRGSQTAVGLITNGTRIVNYSSALLETPPDYVDVSIDGLPETHEEVRGAGSFRDLNAGLRWITRTLPERVWITHTLLANNIRELPAFIKFYYEEYGLQHFSLGTYQPQPYTDARLDIEHLMPVLPPALEALAGISVRDPLEIVIEVGPRHYAEQRALRQFGWDVPAKLFSSDVVHLPNGIVLRINFTAIATGLWRSVRVSPEGHWLAAEDLFEPRRYRERAVTTLRDCGYDARRAYNVGLQFLRASDASARVAIAPRVAPENAATLHTPLFGSQMEG